MITLNGEGSQGDIHTHQVTAQHLVGETEGMLPPTGNHLGTQGLIAHHPLNGFCHAFGIIGMHIQTAIATSLFQTRARAANGWQRGCDGLEQGDAKALYA